MPHSVSLESVRQHLPHVDVTNLRGRAIPMQCLYDDQGEWHMWVSDGQDGLHKIVARPVEACYFAKAMARDEDIRISFIEFLDQRAGFDNLHGLARSVYSDVQNLSTSLAKLELMFRARKEWKGVGRMAATELEYIFLNCRSLFDLFQEIVSRLWKRIELFDSSVAKKNLPTSYRRMVLHDEKQMSVDQIAAKHGIPQSIAEAYASTAPFFEWLREYRDFIAHSGRSFDPVFVADSGFAVSAAEAPFSRMDIWCESNTLKNNLGSLKSASCHVISTTLDAIENVISSLQAVVQFPPPVVPGYSVFMCGPNIKYLSQLADSVRDKPWYVSH